MKKKRNKNLWIFLIISLCVILASTFFIVYYYFINRSYTTYTKSVKPIVNSINDLNTNINVYSSNGEILVDKVNKDINKDVIDKLIESQKRLKELNPPKKLIENHNYLSIGLENNIMIYRQILRITSNSQTKDLTNAVEGLKKYREECKNNYFLAKNKDIEINYPNTLVNFIDKCIVFSTTSLQNLKNSQINQNMNTEFLDGLQEVTDVIENSLLTKNYTNEILRIRNQKLQYDSLLASIENDIKILSDLKIKLSKLTVPSNGADLYDSFENITKEYDIYIQSFKYSVESEKSQSISGNMDIKSLEPLYESSSKNLEYIRSSFLNLKKSLHEYKANIK